MSQIYGYLRVSSIMQVEGDSLDTQAKQITAYAASKNWNVPTENIYIEAGVSGSIDFNERPEGKRLISALKSGDTIIFTKLDRAFRNVRNAFNTLHELKQIGVNVHFLDLGGASPTKLQSDTAAAPTAHPSVSSAHLHLMPTTRR